MLVNESIMKEEIVIRMECPICKTKKDVKFPRSIINQAKQLTTVSITKGLLCGHHFQLFLDKDFKIRGYQKVDYELNPEVSKNKEKSDKKAKNTTDNDKELFENLILDGNYLEYKPPAKNKMSLAEIYEEFWELIDNRNEEFQEFIIKDKRREGLKSEDFLKNM
jgi:hypothetical protein